MPEMGIEYEIIIPELLDSAVSRGKSVGGLERDIQSRTKAG